MRQHLIHVLVSVLYLLSFVRAAAAAAAAAAEEEQKLSVSVYEGPSANGGKCPSEEETIQAGNHVRIHFTVAIDESSKTGVAGKEYDSSLIEGEPIGVTIGYKEIIPGWDEGLLGLCKGDKAILVVPPHMAYGDEGTGTNAGDIPGGATIRFDIQVVGVLEGPPQDEDEVEARAMFANADQDGDGKLSRAEFDEMFVAQLGELGEDMDELKNQLDHFWHAQDYDQDGFLTMEEFLGPAEADDEEDTDPQEEFAMLDTDQDGKLSPAEIESFFTTLGQEVPPDFWEHLDENKDGYITFDEFFVAEDGYDGDLEQEL